MFNSNADLPHSSPVGDGQLQFLQNLISTLPMDQFMPQKTTVVENLELLLHGYGTKWALPEGTKGEMPRWECKVEDEKGWPNGMKSADGAPMTGRRATPPTGDQREESPRGQRGRKSTTQKLVLAEHNLEQYKDSNIDMAPIPQPQQQQPDSCRSSRTSSGDKSPLSGPSCTPGTATSSQLDSGTECVVCGAIASGLHYMVWSCNSCKTFFRRALMENRNYSCYKDGNCPIDARTRCTCRRCRFDKCLRVGMKFTEINIARKRKVHVQLDLGEEHIQEAEDPFVRELLAKERQFRIYLTSMQTPIHAHLEGALAEDQSIFEQPIEQLQQKHIGPENGMNFWDWRTRILSIIMEWMKSFPEFMRLCPSERHKLLVHSAFSLLVFSEAFHTPERFSDRLVFPDGLQLTRNIPKDNAMCQSGLNRAMVTVINKVLVPIRKIQLTEEEYVLLQTLLFFDPDCMSLDESSLEIVRKKREQVLGSLRNYLRKRNSGDTAESARRQGQLFLRISGIQKVAEFKRRFILQNDVSLLLQHQTTHGLQIEIAQRYAQVSFF